MPDLDEKLVRRCQEGNIEAFEELVTRYQQKVYNIAYRMLGNHHDASDLAQEAFIKVFKSIKGFRGNSLFSTWLYHVVTNVCRDELRKRSRYVINSLDEPFMTEDSQLTREVADTADLPDKVVEQRESCRYLQQMIDNLTPEYRIIIIMREIMELSYEEIADILGISLGTVKSRLNRARKSLKNRILEERELFRESERLSAGRREA